MIKVLFFAAIREQLDCDSIDLSLADNIRTVGDLKQVLRERDDIWRKVFTQDSVKSAVNQEMVSESHELASNDEVAFFLPVTGG
jgi:sulfur-carrier protein